MKRYTEKYSVIKVVELEIDVCTIEENAITDIQEALHCYHTTLSHNLQIRNYLYIYFLSIELYFTFLLKWIRSLEIPLMKMHESLYFL